MTLQKIWLLGFPLGHSRSPTFQNAAFAHLGLPLHYELHPIPKDQLASCLSAIANGDAAGANVTLPYKEQAFHLADRCDELALLAGAVNTLVAHEGEVVGYNTDVTGLRRAIKEAAPTLNNPSFAVVLGAGGAARAAVASLWTDPPDEIVVVNRTLPRAQAIADELSSKFKGLRAVSLQDAQRANWWSRVDLLIQATSLGVGAEPQSPGYLKAAQTWRALPWEQMTSLQHVHDLCYASQRTPFLAVAFEHGFVGADGLSMLLYQGADAFTLWTGQDAPVEIMRAALYGGL